MRNKAKRNLLAHIKPEDSLAALENQIDLLSEIILAMLAAQPLETPAAWLKPFAALMVAHSSVQFKDAQISVADLDLHKSRLRTLQRTYFTERSEGV